MCNQYEVYHAKLLCQAGVQHQDRRRKKLSLIDQWNATLGSTKHARSWQKGLSKVIEANKHVKFENYMKVCYVNVRKRSQGDVDMVY